MKIDFDPQADAAFIDFIDGLEGELLRTAMCGAEFRDASVILRFDKSDRLVGLEVLGASRLLPEALLTRAERE